MCEERLKAGVKDDEGNVDFEQLFWLRATLIEALVGTGQSARAESEKAAAIKEAPETWMAGSLQEQLEKLDKPLANVPALMDGASARVMPHNDAPVSIDFRECLDQILVSKDSCCYTHVHLENPKAPRD